MWHRPSLPGIAAAAVLAGAAFGAAAQADALADSSVLFVSNRSGNAQIHRMHADGSGDRALTATPQENTEPAWSPDGRRVAFTSYRDGNAEIYVMNADGSSPQRLTVHPGADSAPAWLPDGRIVFRSVRSGWANFYAMDADGSRLVALTDSRVDKGEPVLSPDGRWLSFVVHGERGSSEIHLMPAAGGPARNLTGAASSLAKGFPSWAPDSRRLAYVESKGLALNVRVVDVEGGDPVAITDNAYTNAWPVWSPDGRRIAFVSSREGTRTEMARGDIWVMQADGTGAVNLTRHPDEDHYPAWSADGRSIYFVSLRDGLAQIYAVPAAGGTAVRLIRSTGFDLMLRPMRAPARPNPEAMAGSPGAAAIARTMP